MKEKVDEMLRQIAIDELKKLQSETDVESAHSEADDVLCTLLCALGHNEVVQEWKKVRKWYA